MNIEACEICGASFESHFEAICRACKDSWFASAPDGTLRSALLTIYGWADDDFLGRDEVRNLLKPHLETLRAVAQPQETDEPAPTRPHERALWRIYDLLGELERNLGRRIGTPENARLLHRAIESCKHWKHPEFELKFAAPEDRPEPELQRARFLEWWKSSAPQHVNRGPQALAWAAWREALHVDEDEEQQPPRGATFTRAELMAAFHERDIHCAVTFQWDAVVVETMVRWRPPPPDPTQEVQLVVVPPGIEPRVDVTLSKGEAGQAKCEVGRAGQPGVDVVVEIEAIVRAVDELLPPLGTISPSTPVKA